MFEQPRKVEPRWDGPVGRFFLKCYVDERDWVELFHADPLPSEVEGYDAVCETARTLQALDGRWHQGEDVSVQYAEVRRLHNERWATVRENIQRKRAAQCKERGREVVRRFSGQLGILSFCPFFNRLAFAFVMYHLYAAAHWCFGGLAKLLRVSAPVRRATMRFCAKAALAIGVFCFMFFLTMPTVHFTVWSYEWVTTIDDRWLLENERELEAQIAKAQWLKEEEERRRGWAAEEERQAKYQELRRLRIQEQAAAQARAALEWELAHPEEVAERKRVEEETKKAQEAAALARAARVSEYRHQRFMKEDFPILVGFGTVFALIVISAVFASVPAIPLWLFGVPLVFFIIYLEKRAWGQRFLKRLDDRWQRYLVNRESRRRARHRRHRASQIRWGYRWRAVGEVVHVLWARFLTAYHGTLCPPVVAKGPMPERYRKLLEE